MALFRARAVWNTTQVGALEEGGIGGQLALTGVEFQALSPMDQGSAVARLAVFARVEPSHKSALVDALREQVRTPLSALQLFATP